MTTPSKSPSDLLSLDAERRVDAVCVRFEAEWRSGRRPRLLDFLTDAVGEERTALMRELILLDLGYRRHSGETPRPEEYLGQFPGSDAAGLADLFSTAEDRLKTQVGDTVVGGRYVLLEKIGQGGMGVVYRGRDTALTRDVAVKLLQSKYPPTSQTSRRFLDEARITAQLQHPGIPPVHEVGELPGGCPYLVMKLINGRTLAEIIAERVADRGSLVGAFEQVCQAVAYAHTHGVVHRDLKPSNVMVGAFGEVQVMDWGLAKFRTETLADSATVGTEPTFHDPRTEVDDDLETRAGSFLGTPAFMSPEQAIGAINLIDERSDVFGLGGILCTILTGQPPFVATTAELARQLAAQKQVELAFARLDASGAEPELIGLCKRCLAGEREARPRNGAEVARAIRSIRAAVEERARQAELETVRLEGERQKAELRVREQRKRQRVQLGLVGAVVLLLLGCGAFLWYSDREAGRRKMADELAEATRLRIETEARVEQARLVAEGLRSEARAQLAQAEQARLAGEARHGVHANLKLAADLRKQYRFPAAAAALVQAEQLARGGAPDRLPEVERAQHDLKFVIQLDDVRFRKWVWIAAEGGRGAFDTTIAPPLYQHAFAERGLDLLTLDPFDAARRIAASPVKGDLIAAMDDWALYEPDEVVRNRLLQITRIADPGEWMDRLRDPAVRTDRAAVEKLAANAPTTSASSATLSVLAEVMTRCGLSPVPLLSAARARRPTDFELAFALGRWCTVNGKDREKGLEIGAYEAARALRPELYAVWNNLGNALIARGDLSGAIAAHEQAISLNRQFAPTHNNLGNAFFVRRDVGDLERAIAAYEQAIELDPGLALAHYNLGNARYARGELDRAIAAHKRAIVLDGDYAPAYSGLGMALYRKGDLDGAVAAHSRAIALDPQLAAAYGNLGNVLAARRGKGDLDGAISAFKKVIDLEPKNATAHYSLGNALAARKDLDGAIGAYQKAIEYDPNFALAHYNLGLALKARGEVDGAIVAYRKAIAIEPKHAAAHYNLGLALKIKGDVNGAIEAYKATVAIDPKHARAHVNLGGIYSDQKNYPAAIACARAAIEADPELANAHALLGLALQQMNDLTGARSALTEATRLDKRWAPALAQLPPLATAPPPREVKR